MDKDSKRIIEFMKINCRKKLIEQRYRSLDEVEEIDVRENTTKSGWSYTLYSQIILDNLSKFSEEEIVFLNDLISTNEWSNYLIAKSIIQSKKNEDRMVTERKEII